MLLLFALCFLFQTLYNAVLICEMCEGAARSGEFLQQLASCDNNKLYEVRISYFPAFITVFSKLNNHCSFVRYKMALYMNRIIDFDLTKSEGKFTVKAGVDPDLDMSKTTLIIFDNHKTLVQLVHWQDKLTIFFRWLSISHIPLG